MLYKKGILHFLQIYNIHKGSKCYKPFTTFELPTSCESKKEHSHIIILSIAKFHKNECTHMYMRYVFALYQGFGQGVPLLYAEFNWH